MDDGFPPESIFKIKFLCHSLSEGDMQKYKYLLYETDVADLYELVAFDRARAYIEYQRHNLLNKQYKHGRN